MALVMDGAKGRIRPMGAGTQLWRRVRWSLADRGAVGTARAIVSKMLRLRRGENPAHAFDREHGVDTSGVITGGQLAAGHAHDVHITAYAGIPPSLFHDTIRRWVETPPAGLAESYAFVDLGCGKGRAVMLASRLHFREVIGVELNPELAGTAERNLEAWRAAGKALRPARVVCGDATEFALPPGPCLLYLANPFGAPVLRRLLERLEARQDGGVIEVLYQTPRQEAVFRERPAWEMLWSAVPRASAEDMADENVYAATDRCNLYRLRR